MANLSKFNDNLFNDFFGERSPFGYFVSPLHGEGVPNDFKVDIKESDNDYVFHAEIPGVNKEDLVVTVDGNLVTIAAEIKQQDIQKQEDKVIRSERYFGSVSRSFRLPVELDQSNGQAGYENGILELVLPKKNALTSKNRIAVK